MTDKRRFAGAVLLQATPGPLATGAFDIAPKKPPGRGRRRAWAAPGMSCAGQGAAPDTKMPGGTVDPGPSLPEQAPAVSRLRSIGPFGQEPL